MTPEPQEYLAQQFEADRTHLRAVAYRLLGSTHEADDAVQEAWLRLSRSDAGSIDNLSGWLTTVVARVSLDMLRSRKAKRESPIEFDGYEVATPLTTQSAPAAQEQADRADPERRAVQADAVGLAMLVVLDKLTPPERLAFVLHDMFALAFDEIAPIVDRSPAATRQLASRARRRVQGTPEPQADLPRQRKVVDAFLAAARGGDFEALLEVLDPDIVMRADQVSVRNAAGKEAAGAPRLAPQIRGAAAVAAALKGTMQAARPALVDNQIGVAWAVGGVPKAVFVITFDGDRIADIDLIGEPDGIGAHRLQLLDG
ncbi:sigma-70 family RNA polymerase sigma factor [Nocardioides speluncae]|uniref:sigma-70 family RNA polymerase sigma factor n=1 Tax=Nocardioides speluncae TaxID=2670337 RepID=UPI001F0BF00D|nr:sigma-70 family RNA polymerase sigma factor [Nocardioides speluncae]